MTKVAGGIAMNVIPDSCEAHVNFRYAPGRSPAEAEERLRELTGGHGRARRRRQLGLGAGRARPPAGAEADPGRSVDGRAQAGVDAGRRVRRGGVRRGQFRARARRPRRTAATSTSRSRRCCRRTACWRRSARDPRSRRCWPASARTRSCGSRRPRARLRAAGVEIIEFGIGEPREETPAFIRAGARGRDHADGAVSERARAAGAAGGDHRLGRAPLQRGARSRHRGAADDRLQGGDLRARERASTATRWSFRTPAYPVYDRGARFAGKEIVELPLREENGWLPALDGVDWERVAILWLNYPNNPTGATAPLAFYEEAAALARRHGFVLASDEAYSELYFGRRAGVRAAGRATASNVVVFNTLSKRSSMPGYRSGFVAGDPEIIARAEEVPAERGRRAAGVLPTRGDRGLERRGARRRGPRALSGQARCDAARAGGDGPAQRGRRRDILPVAGGSRRARRGVDRGGRDRRSRVVLRPGRRGVSPAGAGAAARGVCEAAVSRLRAVPR